MRALNRRFAFTPTLPADAHVRYTGTAAALRRILSIHTPRRLSSNLSCQLDGLLYQVAPTDRGLALRGADVSIVTHPECATEVLWQGRLLPHTLSRKAVKQHKAVDGKEVNSKVDRALSRRTPPQPVGHPWKKKMSLDPGMAPPCAQFEHIRPHLAPAPAS